MFLEVVVLVILIIRLGEKNVFGSIYIYIYIYIDFGGRRRGGYMVYFTFSRLLFIKSGKLHEQRT